MACCFFFLCIAFLSFVVFLTIPLSNGEDTKFKACDTLYSCGKIKNLGYPFWGDDRPKFCGIPDFKLSCNDQDHQPTMNALHTDYVQVPVDVFRINTSSNTIVFSLDKLLNTCHLEPYKNLTMLPTLKLDGNYRNITVFYGCKGTESSFFKYHPKKSFNCYKYDGTKDIAYYFDRQSDINKIAKRSQLCKNNVTFLVNERGLDELGANWLVTAEYKVNSSTCSQCEKSGGRCGSSDDQSSDNFLCHCRDGSHPLVCPRNGMLILQVFLYFLICCILYLTIICW